MIGEKGHRKALSAVDRISCALAALFQAQYPLEYKNDWFAANLTFHEVLIKLKKFIQERRFPDRKSQVYLVKYFLDLAEYDLVQKIFMLARERDLNTLQISLQSDVYVYAIRFFGERGYFQLASRLFADFEKFNEVKGFNIYLHLAGQWGELQAAVNAYEQAVERTIANEATYTALIQVMGAYHQFDYVAMAFAAAKKRGAVDQVMLNCYITAAGLCRRWAAVTQGYAAAIKNGMANMLTVNNFILAAARCNKYSEAWNMFNAVSSNFDANPVTYSIFIKAAGMHDDWDAALHAFNEAKQRGFADAIVYKVFLKTAGMFGHWAAVSQVYAEALQQGFADVVMTNIFITAASRCQQWQMAYDAFKAITPAATIITYIVMLKAAMAQGKWDIADAVYQQAVDLKVVEDDLRHAYIDVLVLRNKEAAAWEIFQQLDLSATLTGERINLYPFSFGSARLYFAKNNIGSEIIFGKVCHHDLKLKPSLLAAALMAAATRGYKLALHPDNPTLLRCKIDPLACQSKAMQSQKTGSSKFIPLSTEKIISALRKLRQDNVNIPYSSVEPFNYKKLAAELHQFFKVSGFQNGIELLNREGLLSFACIVLPFNKAVNLNARFTVGHVENSKRLPRSRSWDSFATFSSESRELLHRLDNSKTAVGDIKKYPELYGSLFNRAAQLARPVKPVSPVRAPDLSSA